MILLALAFVFAFLFDFVLLGALGIWFLLIVIGIIRRAPGKERRFLRSDALLPSLSHLLAATAVLAVFGLLVVYEAFSHERLMGNLLEAYIGAAASESTWLSYGPAPGLLGVLQGVQKAYPTNHQVVSEITYDLVPVQFWLFCGMVASLAVYLLTQKLFKWLLTSVHSNPEDALDRWALYNVYPMIGRDTPAVYSWLWYFIPGLLLFLLGLHIYWSFPYAVQYMQFDLEFKSTDQVVADLPAIIEKSRLSGKHIGLTILDLAPVLSVIWGFGLLNTLFLVLQPEAPQAAEQSALRARPMKDPFDVFLTRLRKHYEDQRNRLMPRRTVPVTASRADRAALPPPPDVLFKLGSLEQKSPDVVMDFNAAETLAAGAPIPGSSPVWAEIMAALRLDYMYETQRDAVQRLARGDNVILASDANTGKMQLMVALLLFEILQQFRTGLVIVPSAAVAHQLNTQMERTFGEMSWFKSIFRVTLLNDGPAGTQNYFDRTPDLLIVTPEVLSSQVLQFPLIWRRFLAGLGLICVAELQFFRDYYFIHSSFTIRRLFTLLSKINTDRDTERVRIPPLLTTMNALENACDFANSFCGEHGRFTQDSVLSAYNGPATVRRAKGLRLFSGIKAGSRPQEQKTPAEASNKTPGSIEQGHIEEATDRLDEHFPPLVVARMGIEAGLTPIIFLGLQGSFTDYFRRKAAEDYVHSHQLFENTLFSTEEILKRPHTTPGTEPGASRDMRTRVLDSPLLLLCGPVENLLAAAAVIPSFGIYSREFHPTILGLVTGPESEAHFRLVMNRVRNSSAAQRARFKTKRFVEIPRIAGSENLKPILQDHIRHLLVDQAKFFAHDSNGREPTDFQMRGLRKSEIVTALGVDEQMVEASLEELNKGMVIRKEAEKRRRKSTQNTDHFYYIGTDHFQSSQIKQSLWNQPQQDPYRIIDETNKRELALADDFDVKTRYLDHTIHVVDGNRYEIVRQSDKVILARPEYTIQESRLVFDVKMDEQSDRSDKPGAPGSPPGTDIAVGNKVEQKPETDPDRPIVQHYTVPMTYTLIQYPRPRKVTLEMKAIEYHNPLTGRIIARRDLSARRDLAGNNVYEMRMLTLQIPGLQVDSPDEPARKEREFASWVLDCLSHLIENPRERLLVKVEMPVKGTQQTDALPAESANHDDSLKIHFFHRARYESNILEIIAEDLQGRVSREGSILIQTLRDFMKLRARLQALYPVVSADDVEQSTLKEDGDGHSTRETEQPAAS